jgi:beta-lactamase class A
LPPPVLSAPAPYEVSFGHVAGIAPRGTKLVVVRAGGRIVAVKHVRGRTFDLRVPLPRRDVIVRVTATDAQGRRGRTSVAHVFGLPLTARPRGTLAHLDPALARRIVPLVRSFPGTSAVYVRDLTTGSGAAWNARAGFPAASTLKLAIAVEALRSLRGKPQPGSYADQLFHSALIYSDNGAANDLEVLFGGSTSSGSARVDSLMRSLGLVDSEMYGGYEREPSASPIPGRVDEQPSYGSGKHTSAYDLAQLFALVHLAAEGKGRLARRNPGFTPADARYLLYLLVHSADRGKLDRFLAGKSATVAHKAGWITSARHDAGLVYWKGGVFSVSVMTYGSSVGTASDILAGRVARRALEVLSTSRRAAASQANPIPSENAKTGTTAWRGPDVRDRAIEAYASETRVAPRETIRFHVSVSPEQPYLTAARIDAQSRDVGLAATATDRDGDRVVYRWRMDGRRVPAQQSARGAAQAGPPCRRGHRVRRLRRPDDGAPGRARVDGSTTRAPVGIPNRTGK